MNALTQDISLLYVEDDDYIRKNMLGFLHRRFDTVWLAKTVRPG